MRIRSLDELTTHDDRTLWFTPMGLSPGGGLPPDRAAYFQQEVIAGCDLVDIVPDETRQSFERLRELHSYGVLFYDAFTIAGDLTHFVAELALRERFIAYYDHQIPLVNKKTGEERPLAAPAFDAVDDALRTGSHKKGDWQIGAANKDARAFHGSMADLLEWARQSGLLPGQRSRGHDALWVRMRNTAAHPGFHRYGPVESARSIRNLAELINQLWGAPTPGGRIFPAAHERVVLAIAWREGEVSLSRPEALAGLDEPDGWTCAVVKAVPDDLHLDAFDAQYERTLYPADLLFGPASITETLDWVGEADFAPDAVEHLDRLFAVQILDGTVSPPRRPDVALGLAPHQRDGEWLLVRADSPLDAYGYGRVRTGLGDDPSPEALEGLDTLAATRVLHANDWATMAQHLERDLGVHAPAHPPVLRVPSWRWSD